MNEMFLSIKNELCMALPARSVNNLFMATFGSRLRAKIQQTGQSEAEIARRAGIEVRTFNNYVNDTREPEFDTLLKICKVIEATPDQLFGLRRMDAEANIGNTPDQFAAMAPPEYVPVRFVDIRPGMGDPAYSEDDGDLHVAYLPNDLVRHRFRALPDDLRVMIVEGPSMAPLLEDGDQVIIDMRKNNPSQPAVFVLWDGFGLVAKWVERVAQSEPPRLKIFSENPRFAPYEALTEEVRIVGRIVWYARHI